MRRIRQDDNVDCMRGQDCEVVAERGNYEAGDIPENRDFEDLVRLLATVE